MNIDKIIEESLTKESIFPMDSAQTVEKPLIGSVSPEDIGKEADEEDKEKELTEISKLYFEGKIEKKQFINFIVENKNVFIGEGINPVKYAKFVSSFLKGLKIVKTFKTVSEPVMLKAYNCATISCQRVMTPQIVKGLKLATEVIPNPQEKEMIQVVIDRLTTLV